MEKLMIYIFLYSDQSYIPMYFELMRSEKSKDSTIFVCINPCVHESVLYVCVCVWIMHTSMPFDKMLIHENRNGFFPSFHLTIMCSSWKSLSFSLFLSLSLSHYLSIYLYIYICVCVYIFVCVCVCVLVGKRMEMMLNRQNKLLNISFTWE